MDISKPFKLNCHMHGKTYSEADMLLTNQRKRNVA